MRLLGTQGDGGRSRRLYDPTSSGDEPRSRREQARLRHRPRQGSGPYSRHNPVPRPNDSPPSQSRLRRRRPRTPRRHDHSYPKPRRVNLARPTSHDFHACVVGLRHVPSRTDEHDRRPSFPDSLDCTPPRPSHHAESRNSSQGLETAAVARERVGAGGSDGGRLGCTGLWEEFESCDEWEWWRWVGESCRGGGGGWFEETEEGRRVRFFCCFSSVRLFSPPLYFVLSLLTLLLVVSLFCSSSSPK